MENVYGNVCVSDRYRNYVLKYRHQMEKSVVLDKQQEDYEVQVDSFLKFRIFFCNKQVPTGEGGGSKSAPKLPYDSAHN